MLPLFFFLIESSVRSRTWVPIQTSCNYGIKTFTASTTQMGGNNIVWFLKPSMKRYMTTLRIRNMCKYLCIQYWFICLCNMETKLCMWIDVCLYICIDRWISLYVNVNTCVFFMYLFNITFPHIPVYLRIPGNHRTKIICYIGN